MALHADSEVAAPPTVIKKYANRRLYNTGTSTYVTLDDLAAMVKGGEDFHVQDAKTGEDLTRSVLTQIIFEQENRGTNLLPITVLRQLIRFYDDSMHAVVPSYLEHSINAFVADQEAIREKMAQGLGGAAAFGAMSDVMQEQTRRNMALFQTAMSNAMAMFSPFAKPATPAAPAPAAGRDADGIDELRAQLTAMQTKLDTLSRKG